MRNKNKLQYKQHGKNIHKRMHGFPLAFYLQSATGSSGCAVMIPLIRMPIKAMNSPIPTLIACFRFAGIISISRAAGLSSKIAGTE